MRKLKTTVCSIAMLNWQSFCVRECRKIYFQQDYNHQQVCFASNQTSRRYRNLAKEEDGCPRCQDNKVPAWRDSPQVQTPRMSTNWKEAEHQSHYSGWNHQDPCIRRTGQMMTCWLDTSGSRDLMMRRKEKRRRSMCQKDDSWHRICYKQKENVSDNRETHRELDESGLE